MNIRHKKKLFEKQTNMYHTLGCQRSDSLQEYEYELKPPFLHTNETVETVVTDVTVVTVVTVFIYLFSQTIGCTFFFVNKILKNTSCHKT